MVFGVWLNLVFVFVLWFFGAGLGCVGCFECWFTFVLILSFVCFDVGVCVNLDFGLIFLA